MITLPPDFPIDNRAQTLVVLLHASTQRAKSLQHVRKIISKQVASAIILCPQLPAQTFSFADPNQMVQELLQIIDQVWAARGSYDRIILIGHSLGALLARKLYVCACGENADAPLETLLDAHAPRPWAQAVERIILLAGINRGWTISHNLPLTKAITFRLGTALGYLCLTFRQRPLLFQIRRGAPFITQLRLQWLAMRQHQKEKEVGKALTIQLLGSIDDLVAPDDNIDLVTGSDFVYLDVPWSNHENVIKMDESPTGKGRAAVMIAALTEDQEALSKRQILPVDANLQPESARADVTDVVFVIHGIRDRGFWTHKIARKVKARGEKIGRHYETETSSYGYFPMLPFLLSWGRRAKVEWLMDQYTENRALFPKADFSFVGHSNGTYLLAKALEEYPACRFKHVVFAGSVVRTRYDWSRLLREGRVQAVLNYVATADWVVAFFPKVFQMLQWQDLGSAGHDGFTELPEHQIKYVRGGHGAALQEKHWDDIAQFVVEGKLTTPMSESKRRSFLITMGGLLAPLVWLLLFALILWGGVALWQNLPDPEWAKTLGLVLYSGLVWTVVTKL